MGDPRRILILRRKAIGDVIVSLPVARALRRRWPDAVIDLVVDRFAAPVAMGCDALDGMLVYDRENYSRGNPFARLGALRSWLAELRKRHYDVVLDLMGTPQTAIWTRVTGAPVRVGRRRRGRTWAYTHVLPADTGPTRYAGDTFLDWVRILGIDPGMWEPLPIVGPATTTRSIPPGRPHVILVPSATWSAKAWPLASFAELARRLRDDLDAVVEIAWGPGEEEATEAIVAASGSAAVAMEPTDLVTLAARLDEADLVITTDSGPKHIAVAQGTPTLTLFGSTDPAGWQPPGRQHDWLTNEVDCHPCDLTECNVPGHPCLDGLTAERVFRRASAMLSRRSEGARA